MASLSLSSASSNRRVVLSQPDISEMEVTSPSITYLRALREELEKHKGLLNEELCPEQINLEELKAEIERNQRFPGRSSYGYDRSEQFCVDVIEVASRSLHAATVHKWLPYREALQKRMKADMERELPNMISNVLRDMQYDSGKVKWRCPKLTLVQEELNQSYRACQAVINSIAGEDSLTEKTISENKKSG